MAPAGQDLAQNNKTPKPCLSYRIAPPFAFASVAKTRAAFSAWVTILVAKSRPVVAIVDDDLGMRGSLQILLSAFAFRTEIYASAEEFLAALPKTEATCHLLDIQLGDLTGIELTRHLLCLGRKIPTIFMTGRADETLRRQAIELDCVAFFEKPFASQQLIEAIVTATGSNPYFER